MKLTQNGSYHYRTDSGVQGMLFLQDLRRDQGSCSPDPPVFESKQSFLERDQDIVTHCFDGSVSRGRQTLVKVRDTFGFD